MFWSSIAASGREPLPFLGNCSYNDRFCLQLNSPLLYTTRVFTNASNGYLLSWTNVNLETPLRYVCTDFTQYQVVSSILYTVLGRLHHLILLILCQGSG